MWCAEKEEMRVDWIHQGRLSDRSKKRPKDIVRETEKPKGRFRVGGMEGRDDCILLL